MINVYVYYQKYNSKYVYLILVKEQCKLDIKKCSFSQRIINEWNKLSTDCVNACNVNMLKNKIYNYFRRAGHILMKNCWTLDKPMASLSTCHLGFFLSENKYFY